MNKLIPLVLATSVAGLSGCGGGGGGGSDAGGGGGGSVSGLEMPVALSVVTASENTTTPRVVALKANFKAVYAALNDPGTDYTTDTARTHVYDPSIESLDTVNMILCVMDQTRASDMVNKGAYIALVNNDKCESGTNESSSGQSGGGSSSQAVEYEKWTVESTRTDNSSPMIVKIWIPGKNSGGGGPGDVMDQQEILVETTVTEGVSDTEPFGKFTMNFKGVLDATLVGGTGTVEPMKGTLFSVSNAQGKPQFKFVNVAEMNDPGSSFSMSFTESANVLLDDANGTSGQAVTHTENNFVSTMGSESKDETFAVSFNGTHFLRGEDSNGDDTIDAQACTSRTTFNTNIWRYNLYHAANGTFNDRAVTAGQRVELNSGFPFTYLDKYGHVGYWGVWYEGGSLADNTTIQKKDFATNTSEDYTVHVAPGKLIRRTASEELLSQFQGVEFNYWGPHPVYTTYNGQWHVSYDGTNFNIVDRFEWGDNGPVTYTDLDVDGNPSTTGDIYPVATALSLTDGQSLWLWSDSLGGNVVYNHDSTILAVDRTVTMYSQDFVKPDDTTLANGASLYCYERCLKGGLLQADVNAAASENDLYHPAVGYDWGTNTQMGTPVQYTLSIANGKVELMDGSNVVSLDGLDLSSIGNSWGNLQTGNMLSTALSASTPPWDAYQATVSYQWESGSNDWNHMVTVQKTSDNSYASFDKPVDISYTHSTANDANGVATYDGKKMRLQYGGPGELWGFPWEQQDPTCDSKTTNCRWVSAVTLDDGITLSDGTNNFVTKGMEKEQTMQEVMIGDCAALDVSTALSTLTLPVAADIGTVSFTLADKPAVTDAPAVIEGELQ